MDEVGKELSLASSSESELTKRGGEDVSSVNLFSHQMNVSVNAEIIKKVFYSNIIQAFQCRWKRIPNTTR